MEVISQKNLDILIRMGFEITYRADNFITLYHGEHDFGIDLYHSDPRDDYQGVYMSITRGKQEIKHCKGRNVISNTERYIEMISNLKK